MSDALSIGLMVCGVSFYCFAYVDCMLYDRTVKKYGPQHNVWPGSGFYVWWKCRGELK